MPVLFCLTTAANADVFVHEADPKQDKKTRLCILPFYDTAFGTLVRSDLGSLLEAYLAKSPWLELVPAGRVYEKTYEVEGDPWLVKGIWEDGREPTDAETYTWLRERWVMRAKARFPADYYVTGKVVATGRKRNVIVDLMKSTVPDKVVFTFLGEAATAEELPQALETIAEDLRGFFQRQRSEAYLKGLHRKRLAQLCPLNAAVKEAEKAVEANPESPSLRILLLSFYAEDRSAYGDQVLLLAGEIARAWDPGDTHTKELSYQLGIDPFLLLCEEQEKRDDWEGVLEAARLGIERHPLRSAEYTKWEEKAEERLRAGGETQ
jgi:hypothetical protein